MLAYDESTDIGVVIAEVKRFFKIVIVVNNGSDKTSEIAADMDRQQYDPFQVSRLLPLFQKKQT
jgi:glycosyltransferase involved in cell wall biosynthesis